MDIQKALEEAENLTNEKVANVKNTLVEFIKETREGETQAERIYNDLTIKVMEATAKQYIEAYIKSLEAFTIELHKLDKDGKSLN